MAHSIPEANMCSCCGGPIPDTRYSILDTGILSQQKSTQNKLNPAPALSVSHAQLKPEFVLPKTRKTPRAEGAEHVRLGWSSHARRLFPCRFRVFPVSCFRDEIPSLSSRCDLTSIALSGRMTYRIVAHDQRPGSACGTLAAFAPLMGPNEQHQTD